MKICRAYEGVLRKLIHLFKFEGVRTLQRPLGSLLARALPRECSFDAIVPVPLHWRRRWQILGSLRELSERTSFA